MACACVDILQSLCLRLKGAICRRSRIRSGNRRVMHISEPFDFKHVSDTPHGFDSDAMNAFCEKAAASRMIPMEDQSSAARPASSPVTGTGAHALRSSSPHHSHHYRAMGISSGIMSTPRAPQQAKSRVGYRGLTSSSVSARGGAQPPPVASTGAAAAYVSLTESRPSLTQSFAATVDSTSPLSPTHSFSTSSTSLTTARRGQSFSSAI